MEGNMKGESIRGVRFVAILLIVAGILGLVYRSVTYTQQDHKGQIGSLELTVKENHTVNVPVGVSVGAIVAGAALLIL